MKNSMKLIIVATAVLLAAVIASPVAARGNITHDGGTWTNFTVKDIGAGDVIFEYELGLNLTPLRPAAGAAITELRKYADDDITKALINGIPVANEANFDVLPAAIAGNYGIYYPFNGAALKNAIQIKAPALTLDAVLTLSHVDSVNGKSLTRDNNITFKISAPYLGAYYVNNSWMGTQPGLTGQTLKYPLAAKVEITTPGGGKVTQIGNPLVNLGTVYINGSEFYTDAACTVTTSTCGIAPTGTLDPTVGISLDNAEAGTYTAVLKFVDTTNLTSGFKERAPSSNSITFTVLSKPLTITTNKETVTRGNPFVVTITGESKYSYWVYLKATSVSATRDYPLMTPGQVNVNQTVDVNVLNILTDEAGKTATIANVTTAADGTRSIQFDTNSTTDDRKFTVKVRDPADASKYDQVDVSIEKGKVTITYEGTGSYYLGETIKLTGTNTDSKKVYLFLKGPNLNSNGVSLADIGIPSDWPGGAVTAKFKEVDVNTDNTWSFKWDTSKLNESAARMLDAGTYTVYGVATPDHYGALSGKTYETASIVLKKPFITASASTNTLAKGDKLFIRGTAEGKPTNVFVWIFGKNYRNMQNAASVRSDATYEYKLDRGDTSGLYPGQYFVVVQHPMMNGLIDICSDAVGTAGSKISNCTTQYQGYGPIVLSGLQASDAATALVDALNTPNVDDTYTKLSFMLEEAWIRIDTIGDKYVGDTFKITGTTNLAEGDSILMTVVSSSFKPTEKTQTGEFSGASGTVTVQKGDTYNTFSFDVDASTFRPDEYLVKAESIEPSQTATATFNVLEGQATTVVPATTPPVVTTAPGTPPPTEATTAVPVTTAKPQPGFGALVALVGLGAVALLVLRRH